MRLLALVLGFLAVHAGLGWSLYKEWPQLDILPPLPNAGAVRALSMGDSQFLYRYFVLNIQNAGDTGGRFTPMGAYDVTKVVAWLSALQNLDDRSSLYTALAVRYFSQIQNVDDIRKLIGFVDRDVDRQPARKWYWQTQVVAMARDRVKDVELALDLSRKLNSFAAYVPNGYMWVLQMEPVLLYDLGRKDEARQVMERVVAKYGARMIDVEKSWTETFFERLK